jgi:NTP pyrophosphatase (non-canonical NTP hydrolase)
MAHTCDAETTIEDLKQAVLKFAQERDWLQFHTPKNLSMAIAKEAAELMEHFLWAESAASTQVVQEPKKRGKIEEELADVMILLLQFANVTGIDLATAYASKLAENNRKYPIEKARGNAAKYTDL